jgi:hypothetical protein
MGTNAHAMAGAVSEAVRTEEQDGGTWAVYPSYSVIRVEGDAYAVADVKELREIRRRRLYRPLVDTPDLLLEFAALGDGEVTEEDWVRWLHRNGALERSARGGRDETFSGFAGEAGHLRETLRLYEAASAKPAPDQAAIEGIVGNAEIGGLAPGRRFVETPEDAGVWALAEVEMRVRHALQAECYPELYQRAFGQPHARTWGFLSLRGALWLELYFLMTATGEKRTCEAPGCNKVISFREPELPEPPTDATRKKKRTYSNKRFCSDRCRVRHHYWNRQRTDPS